MEWFDTESRRQLADTAERFARKELPDGPGDPLGGLETAGAGDAIRGAGALGLLSCAMPEAMGGIGLDGLSRSLLWEKIAEGRADVAVILAAHTAAMGLLASLEEVPAVREWLLASADPADAPRLAGLAVPEPAVGLDRPARPSPGLNGPEAAPRLRGDLLFLNGPPAASHLVLYLPEPDQSGAILWLDPDRAAAHCADGHPGSGLEALSRGRLIFSEPTSLAETLLCTGGRAGELGARMLTDLRLGLAAVHTGNAAAALRTARTYAAERFQTGRPILGHQEVQRMLEQMETRLEASRSFVYRASAFQGGPRQALRLARQADRFCGEACEQVCLDAVQVLGGYGYMKDYGVERRLRDCKSLQGLLGAYASDWLGER